MTSPVGVTLALCFLLVPLAVEAQQAGKVYRLGHLGNAPLPTIPEMVVVWNAYVQGLREHGFVEGRNLLLEMRFSGGDPAKFPDFAADLVRLKVDLITALSGAAVRAAKEATATIPLVMTGVSEPVATGLITSLARPGGNVTGLADFGTDLMPKRLELLKEVVPRAVRVAVPSSAAFFGGSVAERRGVNDQAARALGMTLLLYEMARPEHLTDVLAAVARERPDALMLSPSPINNIRAKEIAEFALQNRLPTIFAIAEGVRAGGLMSYGINQKDIYRRAADYVAKILNGAKPGDLPVEQPTKLELVINLKTAKALGLTIPQSILIRADEVIQ